MTESLRETDGGVQLEVRRVGGIDEASVTLTEGVTLISGANASNKSSLLRSLSGVLGGPVPPLKSDAESGSVRMSVGETDYSLELARRDGETVVTDADRYSTASDRCELFVALTETNPIRQAVQSGTELYDLLMRPVDTDAIRAEISRLRTEKERLDDRLEELDAMESRLPGLRTRQNSLREELSDVEAALRETRDAVEAAETPPERVEAGTVEAELNEKRDDRSRLRERIKTQEDAVESLREERDSVEEQLEDLDAVESDVTVAELESELEQLHYQKQQLTSTINALAPIVEMNEQLLDDGTAVPDAMTSEDVVDELDPSSRSITCWTCGSTVDRAQIAEQVEAVETIVREKRNRRDTVTERIQLLTEQKRDLEHRQDERETLQERRAALAEEIDERERTLASLRAEMRDLEREIEALGTKAETESEQLSDYYEEISDLEYERGQLTTELEAVTEELEAIEAELDDREAVAAERDRVAASLRDRRERIERLERELVSTFNQEIQEVLDSLDYRSVERVWLERRSTGSDPSAETEFELHVVRESDGGSAYEETIDNLSKSERSVIGIVVALAGYLVYDVGEDVPFVVVDAVEMFDADRIRGLMEHFDAHADYVVATVLPEDRDRLDGVYQTIPTSAMAADS